MANTPIQNPASATCVERQAAFLFPGSDEVTRTEAANALSKCMPELIKEIPTGEALARKGAVCNGFLERVKRDKKGLDGRSLIRKFAFILFTNGAEEAIRRQREYINCEEKYKKMFLLQDLADVIARRVVEVKDLFDLGTISRDEFLAAAEYSVQYYYDLHGRFPNFTHSIESLEKVIRQVEDEMK